MLEPHQLDCIADDAEVVATCYVARYGKNDRFRVLLIVCKLRKNYDATLSVSREYYSILRTGRIAVNTTTSASVRTRS